MSHLHSRRTRLLIASLGLVANAGCGDSSGPGEPDDPGILLAAMAGDATPSLSWTSDGTELVYAAPNSLNAVSVSTHMVRLLDASTTMAIRAFSGVGDRIYFGAVETPLPANPTFRVSRVNRSAGALEILTTDSWHGPGGDYVVVSPDERFLVAQTTLYDLQTAARIDLPPGSGTPLGFSPDGTKILYRVSAPIAGFSLISTADGSSQPLHSAGSFYYGHRWEGNSPQLLDYRSGNDTTQISEIDGVTGTTRDLAELSGTPYLVLLANWSPDGRTLGAWMLQGSKAKLFVMHSGSEPTVVATVTPTIPLCLCYELLSAGFGSPEFSPSGNSVAYNYYRDDRRSIYMKSGI